MALLNEVACPDNPHLVSLPDEIVILICARLPCKGVGRFRCCSPYWNRMLTSSYFFALHRRCSPPVYKLLLVPFIGPNQCVGAVGGIINIHEVRFPPGFGYVAASVSGLCLLIGAGNSRAVLNPITGAVLYVPPSPYELPIVYSYKTPGMVCSPTGEDLKVVVVSYWNSGGSNAPGYTRSIIVDTFSLDSGEWTRSPPNSFTEDPNNRWGTVAVHGAIHFIRGSPFDNTTNVISAFDLYDGCTREISGPSQLRGDGISKYGLCDVGGELCLIRYHCGQHHLWVMCEYGVADTWTLIRIPRDGMRLCIEPICLWSPDELMMLTDTGRLMLFDVRDMRFSRFRIGTLDTLHSSASLFRETKHLLCEIANPLIRVSCVLFGSCYFVPPILVL